MNITIDGQTFKLVRTREYMPVEIYKGKGVYLRIGRPDLIKTELELHKKMLDYNFPVAELIKEGSFDNKSYYIEKSLGDDILAEVLWQDYEQTNQVSDKHFQTLLELTKKFALAQLATATTDHDMDKFLFGFHFPLILKELSQLKQNLVAVAEKIKAKVSTMPNVLTHGDLNPFNFCKQGVIDFGNVFYAPAGYDLISVIYHTYNFPKDRTYEMYRRHEFNENQQGRYFADMDDIYQQAGFPKVSNYIDEFAICRSIFAAARMEQYPKIQQWRYAKLEKLLTAYLEGQSVVPILLSDD